MNATEKEALIDNVRFYLREFDAMGTEEGFGAVKAALAINMNMGTIRLETGTKVISAIVKKQYGENINPLAVFECELKKEMSKK